MIKITKGGAGKLVLIVLTGLLSTAAGAVLSQSTGRIHGHPPSVSGLLVIAGPDGMQLNDPQFEYPVSPFAKAADFSVITAAGIAVTDFDGDETADINLTKKAVSITLLEAGGESESPFPESDLSMPFYPKYESAVIVLRPTADVTVLTKTGTPDSTVIPAMTNWKPYHLVVPSLTAEINSIDLLKDNAAANGTDENSIKVLVLDSFGLPVNNAQLTFSAKTNGPFKPQIIVANTNAEGIATVSFTTKTEGTYPVYIQGLVNLPTHAVTIVPKSVDIHFVPAVDPTKSAVAATPGTINTGQQSQLTYTVNSLSGKPVPGLAVTTAPLTGTAAAGAIVSAWKETVPGVSGIYTATLIAGSTPGTIAVMPQVNGSNGVTTPASIVVSATTLQGIVVNGMTFGPTSGFPTTGFIGAQFTVTLNNGTASDFNWSSDKSWVSVNNGVVTFNGNGDSNRVTVTATPKDGGVPLKYSFSLKKWFINYGTTYLSKLAAMNDYCKSRGAVHSLLSDLSYGKNIRGTGSLYSEWGNVSKYNGSGFMADLYWSSETYTNTHGTTIVKGVMTGDGSFFDTTEDGGTRTVCTINL